MNKAEIINKAMQLRTKMNLSEADVITKDIVID